MANIFTTDLNPLHFNRYNYSLPPQYSHKEIYDDFFQNRQDSYIGQKYYLQKFQTTDIIYVQCITNGLATINIDCYSSDGTLFSTTAMNVVADAGVALPAVLNVGSVSLSAFDEDIYFFVLSSDGVPLRISEYVWVRQQHENTLLFEYRNSTNKYNTYFNNFTPMLRVEGILTPWFIDSEQQDYQDEYFDPEVIDGIPEEKRGLRIGRGGVPDWMAKKINRIMMLNRTFIEGVQYSRTPGSKIETKSWPGLYMNDYGFEISMSKNRHGLATDETGSEQDVLIIYTIDAQAIGETEQPGEVINITLPNS